MSSPEYDKLMDHDYDGIKEYDNPLPGWWVWLFWLSIFFAVPYFFWYHIGEGSSLQEEYDTSVATFLERQFSSLGELTPDNETIIGLFTDPESSDKIAALSGMFQGKCAKCHRADGGGNIGPNLTDDFWKNVKEPADIYRVIRDGVPGKSMASWKSQLRDIQIILLSAYVASIRGSEPASPKPPEGSLVPPWETFVAPPEEGEATNNEEGGSGP